VIKNVPGGAAGLRGATGGGDVRGLRALQLPAREEQADYLAQDCMKLEQEMLKREEPAMPWVQARKVVMEQRRWYAGKVYRSAYGDDPGVNIATQVNVSVSGEKLASIRERLEAARTLVPPRREQGAVDAQSTALPE
jgi:hypothetical protein